MKIIKKLKFELIIFSVVFSIRGVLYFFGKDFDLFWPLAFVISFVSVSMFKLKFKGKLGYKPSILLPVWVLCHISVLFS